MLTADRLTWTLGASVGIKFSKQFAMSKQAQRVAFNPNQEAADPNAGSCNQGGTGDDDNTEL
jgi:hypothetical protein